MITKEVIPLTRKINGSGYRSTNWFSYL